MRLKKPEFIVNMKWISLLLPVLAFLSMGLAAVKMQDAGTLIRERTAIEESLRQCERESQALADASDYLTFEVWRFTAAREKEHLRNYWNEVETLKSRDKAMQRLAALSLTDEEQALVSGAKAESDALVSGEARAMRLIAESLGMAPDAMPAEVAAVRLSPEQAALPAAGKRELAVRFIFGSEYTRSKQIIKDKIKAFRALLRERKTRELDAAAAKTREALKLTQAYNLAVLLLLLMCVTLFFLLVIRPFRVYALSLRQPRKGEPAPLRPMGSKETRAFAEAFNRIRAEWSSQKRRLEDEQFRFRVAMENASMIIYEYDPAADVYTGYSTLEDARAGETRENMERVIPRFLERAVETCVEGDALARVRELARCGTGFETELRVRRYGSASPFLWARLTGTPIRDENGSVTRIIGKITNIRSEKEKEFALEEAKTRDSLTGLYNREAGIRKVRDFMERKSPEEVCGMMLLDMDDFTRLNNAEGHVFADAILQEVAGILRAQTGPDDILIRLGGDEFMLFVKQCPKSRATVLGPRIAERIRGLSRPENPDLRVSASIGMCVTAVVDEYSGLYRCAESTLNYVKANSKGQAACYLDTSNELGTMLVQVYTERHSINEIDRTGDLEQENLLSFALELLGKAKNLDDALFLLLARIGRTCGLDRVSIAEINNEYLSFRYPCQWARETADLQMGQTFYCSAEQLRDLASGYAENRLSEAPFLSAAGMGSCLHTGFPDHGAYVGALCFEARQEGRAWPPEERKLLAETAKIIASFILKARADAVSQAKSDFLSRISHEIRTPMNAITGMTAIAKMVLDDRQKALDCLDKIESANTYLLGLINDILDMSRIESGKMELNLTPVDPGQLLEKLAMLMRPQAEAAELCFTVENAVPSGRTVLADELRLNQVLINLAGNAVKFTGPGGNVTVGLVPVEESEREIRLRFTVADTGIGIGREALGRIFNAFEQEKKDTSAAYGGTGLGLAISSRLVQMMGGALEVRSDVGTGSEFFFTLAFSRAPAQEAPAAAGPDAACAFPNDAGKRILLAEDNPLNREIAETILDMNGFAVETAANGKEALDLFEGREPFHYDAVLMDIRMPIMDGLEATRRIRTLGKPDSRTIPIIAMTANAFDEDMKKSLDSGMSCHLSKPLEVDKLWEALRRCMAAQQENDAE